MWYLANYIGYSDWEIKYGKWYEGQLGLREYSDLSLFTE